MHDDRIASHARLMGISRDELARLLADPATDWDALDRQAAAREITERRAGRARELGEEHARAGEVAWYIADDNHDRIMAAVGETGPDTAANHDARFVINEAYDAGYYGEMIRAGRWHVISPAWVTPGRWIGYAQATDGHATEADGCDHGHPTRGEALACAVDLAAQHNAEEAQR